MIDSGQMRDLSVTIFSKVSEEMWGISEVVVLKMPGTGYHNER